MRIESVDSPGLGNRWYVIVEGPNAVVVDPPRDVGRVESVLAALGADGLDVVVETHRHADYVSGGLELSRCHRATYVVPPGDPEPTFAYTPAVDGAELTVGNIALRPIHTPGHTPHHMSYVVAARGEPVAVCTGGSLLHGGVGRTDLWGAERIPELTRAQWLSAHRLARELPRDVDVLPTHGFGSLCSAGSVDTNSRGSLEDEVRSNPALVDGLESFVANGLARQRPIPRHYARVVLLNAAGPSAVDATNPAVLSPAELQRARGAGHWLVDLRHRREFAAEHMLGSVNVGIDGPFAAYLPWLLPPGAGVVLLADSLGSVERGQRQLAAVGIDRPLGMAVGTPRAWAGHDTTLLGRYPVGGFAEMSAAVEAGQAVPLDVRDDWEWRESHLRGALHLSLPDLAALIDPARPARQALVPGRTWAYCAGGYRAAIAASLLAAAGVQVSLVDESYGEARLAGLVGSDQVVAVTHS